MKLKFQKIHCNTGTNGSNCVCPAECLFYVNSTGSCHPINCWNWNSIKSECEQAGKPFVPAIVLYILIFFTGVFGSGFKYWKMGYFRNIYGYNVWRLFINLLLWYCLFLCYK